MSIQLVIRIMSLVRVERSGCKSVVGVAYVNTDHWDKMYIARLCSRTVLRIEREMKTTEGLLFGLRL
jgi:hypothetical protein